jgi:hypothetical protein
VGACALTPCVPHSSVTPLTVGCWTVTLRDVREGLRDHIAPPPPSLPSASTEIWCHRYELLMVHPHPHVLPVYGMCTDAPDGRLRLVMRVCRGGSLEDALAAAAPEVNYPGAVHRHMRRCIRADAQRVGCVCS